MATRGRTTFQKRQKEMARKERQQRKAERREHRRMTRAIADRTPPQDPAEATAEHEETERADHAAGWRSVLRGHTNL